MHSSAPAEAAIAHFPLVSRGDLPHAASATGANQRLIAALAPHPQLQAFGRFIDLASPHPIAGPSQNPRPVVVSQTAECSPNCASRQSTSNRGAFKFSLRAEFSIGFRAAFASSEREAHFR